MNLTIAARPSVLSIKQVEIAVNYIKQYIPNFRYKILKVRTKGDLIKDRPLHLIGSKGIFEKEVNKAVLRGEADVAVHSLKDLPSEIDSRLEISLIIPRESPYDILVPRRDLKAPESLESLERGKVVGTSSVRRYALIKYYNPLVIVKNIRGNVDTRLRKLDNHLYDYIVIAEVALTRLGISRPYLRLPLEKFVPSPGQGFIAIVSLKNSKISRILKKLNKRLSWYEMLAERSFLKHSRAGCNVPLGGVAINYGTSMIKFIAAILSPDGNKGIWIKVKGDLSKAENVGKEAGELIYSLYDKVLKV